MHTQTHHHIPAIISTTLQRFTKLCMYAISHHVFLVHVFLRIVYPTPLILHLWRVKPLLQVEVLQAQRLQVIKQVPKANYHFYSMHVIDCGLGYWITTLEFRYCYGSQPMVHGGTIFWIFSVWVPFSLWLQFLGTRILNDSNFCRCRIYGMCVFLWQLLMLVWSIKFTTGK